MSGFFRRVSRYARPALAEQRENRLTEVFAAVLERSDALAVALARAWVSPRPGDATVALCEDNVPVHEALDEPGFVLRRPLQTQRFTRGGDFVDLELQLANPEEPGSDIVIWVEVKHGADPHEFQLENYLRDVCTLGARAGVVVLLAPRRSYPFTPSPPQEVLQRSWEPTAELCQRVGLRSDAVARFLIDEFVDYLKEESLVAPDLISPIHLVALAEYENASAGIAYVCELASGHIERI